MGNGTCQRLQGHIKSLNHSHTNTLFNAMRKSNETESEWNCAKFLKPAGKTSQRRITAKYRYVKCDDSYLCVKKYKRSAELIPVTNATTALSANQEHALFHYINRNS